MCSVATGVVNVCMTIPGIIMVEKLGRRSFLLYGALWSKCFSVRVLD